MARYFYAFRWAYGIGATWDDGSWPGSLRVFDSRAERDAWVADDVFDEVLARKPGISMPG